MQSSAGKVLFKLLPRAICGFYQCSVFCAGNVDPVTRGGSRGHRYLSRAQAMLLQQFNREASLWDCWSSLLN
jgi:hypothetical protein